LISGALTNFALRLHDRSSFCKRLGNPNEISKQEMAWAKTGLDIAPETGTSFRLSEILIFKSWISVAMLAEIPAA
jgi:hypothetical protein